MMTHHPETPSASTPKPTKISRFAGPNSESDMMPDQRRGGIRMERGERTSVQDTESVAQISNIYLYNKSHSAGRKKDNYKFRSE